MKDYPFDFDTDFLPDNSRDFFQCWLLWLAWMRTQVYLARWLIFWVCCLAVFLCYILYVDMFGEWEMTVCVQWIFCVWMLLANCETSIFFFIFNADSNLFSWVWLLNRLTSDFTDRFTGALSVLGVSCKTDSDLNVWVLSWDVEWFRLVWVWWCRERVIQTCLGVMGQGGSDSDLSGCDGARKEWFRLVWVW